MILRSHKCRLCKLVGELGGEAPEGGFKTVLLSVRQGDAASSSSPLALPTQREVSAAGPSSGAQVLPSTGSVTHRRYSAGSQSHGSAEASQDEASPEALLEQALDVKRCELMQFLLRKYRMKELFTRAEMLSYVIREYKGHFHEIFSKVLNCLQVALGIDLRVVDPNQHCYMLETALGLTYDGMQDHHQSMPKTSFLIMVLGLIFSKGNCAPEEELWESLSVMEVYDGREHHLYGEPRKLLTEEWVREGYIEYRQVPHSDPARYEFLWGPRAHAETTKMRVLKHLAKFNQVNPRSFSSLYDEALRDENERAQAGEASQASGDARA